MTNKELLEAAIKHEMGNASEVARKTDYNKTTVSLIKADKYVGRVNKFFEKLRTTYDFLENGSVKCPGLRGDIHLKVCKSYQEAVREGRTLKGAAFAAVKDICPFCPMGAKYG